MNRTGQRLLAVTVAGGGALSYPMLAAATVEGRVAGIPILYVYLFVVWSVVIAAMALVIERS